MLFKIYIITNENQIMSFGVWNDIGIWSSKTKQYTVHGEACDMHDLADP